MSPPTAPSWAFIPDDLLTEFLSLLPVKSLLRFKCVSKSLNSLISDPKFVKLHLKKSKSHNPQFTITTNHTKFINGEVYLDDYSIIPFPINSFLDNHSFTLYPDHHYRLTEKFCDSIAGYCNGLICLIGNHLLSSYTGHQDQEYWFRLWNPATREISENIGCFIDYHGFIFNFGCDISTDTFKLVASRYIEDQSTCEVRVLSFGDSDSDWRNIQSFPVVPLGMYTGLFVNNAVFLNGTLNWLAIRNDIPCAWYPEPPEYHDSEITVEQFVIVSFDLGTETYNMYTLHGVLDEVPSNEPSLRVLDDCLCFTYTYKKSNFIIWQMKKFGIEESWTQFLKITLDDLQLQHYHDLEILDINFPLVYPLFLSKDGDTLILRINTENQAILYNWRDHRVEQTEVYVIIDDETGNHFWWEFGNIFVESLTPVC